MDTFCGVVIDLFDDINFGGSFRTLVEPLADFRNIEFNDRASSAIVRPLPGFMAGDAVRLWSDINFMGVPLDLGPGQFPDFRLFNFNDVASSLQCIRVPAVVAEDRQRENLTFRLTIVTPAGTTLVSVQQNRILNLQATGAFIGPTTVRVTGTFVDEIVVTIRDATGATRTATGRVTLPFSKTINFPQLAGLDQTQLQIVVVAQNPSNTFTLAGNLLTKNVQFDLITRVIRRTTSTSQVGETGADETSFEVIMEDTGSDTQA